MIPVQTGYLGILYQHRNVPPTQNPPPLQRHFRVLDTCITMELAHSSEIRPRGGQVVIISDVNPHVKMINPLTGTEIRPYPRCLAPRALLVLQARYARVGISRLFRRFGRCKSQEHTATSSRSGDDSHRCPLGQAQLGSRPFERQDGCSRRFLYLRDRFLLLNHEDITPMAKKHPACCHHGGHRTNRGCSFHCEDRKTPSE